jgi:hypothetical protein
VKLVRLVAVRAGVVTVIRPVAAPEGTLGATDRVPRWRTKIDGPKDTLLRAFWSIHGASARVAAFSRCGTRAQPGYPIMGRRVSALVVVQDLLWPTSLARHAASFLRRLHGHGL